MLRFKLFQVAALGVAALGMSLAAPDASAGSCSSRQSYNGHGHDYNYSHGHGGYVSGGYRDGSVSLSFSVGSSRHYDSCRTQPVFTRTVYRTTSTCAPPVTYHARDRHHHQHSHHSQPSGHWSRCYRPPVYETRYYSCGTPYRVCVRAGYYENVWVSY